MRHLTDVKVLSIALSFFFSSLYPLSVIQVLYGDLGRVGTQIYVSEYMNLIGVERHVTHNRAL